MQPKKNEMTFSLECGTAQKIVTKCIVHFQLHFILNHEILIHWNCKQFHDFRVALALNYFCHIMYQMQNKSQTTL